MSITANEVMYKLHSIHDEIDSILDCAMSHKEEDGVYDKIRFGESPDEVMLKNSICLILDKLADVNYKLDYLDRPIYKEGVLKKNQRGRYELDDHDFTSGHGIEILVNNEDTEKEEWVITRIEHDGTDYYAVGYKDLCLNGVRARIREPRF